MSPKQFKGTVERMQLDLSPSCGRYPFTIDTNPYPVACTVLATGNTKKEAGFPSSKSWGDSRRFTKLLAPHKAISGPLNSVWGTHFQEHPQLLTGKRTQKNGKQAFSSKDKLRQKKWSIFPFKWLFKTSALLASKEVFKSSNLADSEQMQWT